MPPTAAVHLAPPISHTPSTYDDIMDTLRLLEEVPAPLEPPLTARKTQGQGGLGGSGGLSEGKLQSILSYLDQVEKADFERSQQWSKPHPQDHQSLINQAPVNEDQVSRYTK